MGGRNIKQILSNYFVSADGSLITSLSVHDESIITVVSIVVENVLKKRLVIIKKRTND
ncbi:hypothetical protein [Wolbachia endosymbiont of Onchocerca gibsoni]|uniref:hypothetical protein n=1 Tax=Wolbachia endosymbiont of Onchocerca gibsoni TaxID=118986 RepID=UPI0023D81647|nr:hypothetical protein [Wolbachia endosymbiont of Onchocerca gibsoni]